MAPDALSLSAEANKQLIREHYEATVNDYDARRLDQQLAPDFCDHTAPPGAGLGPEMVKAHMARVKSSFPDLKVVILHILAENDLVSVHARWTGTHMGEYQGVAATGRAVEFEGAVLWRISDCGRITDRWGFLDTAALMRQLQS